MASNRIPDPLAKRVSLAEAMAEGLSQYEAIIGIKQNKEAELRAEITALSTTQSAFDAARSAKGLAAAAQDQANFDAKHLIANARTVLAAFLGRQYSDAWVAAGFHNNTTSVPDTQEERQALLAQLHRYFLATPELQNPPLGVTAELAEQRHVALARARAGFNNAATVAGTAKAVRDVAFEALGKRMRGLIDELSQLLDAGDPRWYAFGLNAPADPATPSVPDGLVFNLNGTSAYLDWADCRRADRYRVWKQIGEGQFAAIDTVRESDYMLTGLSRGTTRVQVTAVNAAGESQPSATLEIVVP